MVGDAVLAGAILVGLGVLARRALLEPRRRKALTAFADELGLTYYNAGDRDLVHRFHGYPFGLGTNQRVKNTITGRFQGYPVTSFDYSYDDRSGADSSRCTKTVAVTVLELPVALSWLSVSHEHAVGAVLTAIGEQDLEMESEDFNRRFRVSAIPPKFGYDVLNPRLMQLLLSVPDVPAFRIDCNAIISCASKEQQPADVLHRMTVLAAVAQHIPDFVWTEYATGSGVTTAPVRPAGETRPAGGFVN